MTRTPQLSHADRRAQLDALMVNYTGPWSWLSNFPSFFGFIPSSRAICTCACDK